MNARTLLILGGASGALAVALGAFGAHALSEMVSPERLETWRTASSYQLVHALALVVAGVASRQGLQMNASGVLFALGTLLFSGSLYALVLLDLPILGAVAPLGGLSFIAGWLLLAWAAWREPSLQA